MFSLRFRNNVIHNLNSQMDFLKFSEINFDEVCLVSTALIMCANAGDSRAVSALAKLPPWGGLLASAPLPRLGEEARSPPKQFSAEKNVSKVLSLNFLNRCARRLKFNFVEIISGSDCQELHPISFPIINGREGRLLNYLIDES